MCSTLCLSSCAQPGTPARADSQHRSSSCHPRRVLPSLGFGWWAGCWHTREAAARPHAHMSSMSTAPPSATCGRITLPGTGCVWVCAGEFVSVFLCELVDVPPKMSEAMRTELLGALQSVHTEIVQWDKSMRFFGCDFTEITGFYYFFYSQLDTASFSNLSRTHLLRYHVVMT